MERRRLRFCGPSDVIRIGTLIIIIWAVDGSGHVAIFRVRRGIGAEIGVGWGGSIDLGCGGLGGVWIRAIEF